MLNNFVNFYDKITVTKNFIFSPNTPAGADGKRPSG
jgi:hypothetical protein